MTCHARGHHRGTEDAATEGHPPGRRHLDRIRFGAASLTVVSERPLSDVTVVDGEKAVLECRVTAAPAAEVTKYVDTAFTVRGLRAGAGIDDYFRVIAENGAALVPRSRSQTRWLLISEAQHKFPN